MNLKKILAGFGVLPIAVVPTMAVISCDNSDQYWKGHTPNDKNTDLFTNLNIELKSQTTLTDKMINSYKTEAQEVETQLTKEWNRQFPNDQREIKVKVTTNENTSTIAQRLDNGAIGAAFLTPSFFGEYAEGRKAKDPLAKARKYGIHPALITGRYPIAVGKDASGNYEADNDSNTSASKLGEITEYLNKTYMDIPGTRYDGQKDKNEKNVEIKNFIGPVGDETSSNNAKDPLYVKKDIGQETATANYRGVILMAGNETERAAIKKAWVDKDWPEFRSHKLLFQKNTSVSGYQYSQLMLKDHFGKDAFTSIKQENLSYPEKVFTGQSGMMGRMGVNGNIGFTYFKDLVKNNGLYNSGEQLRILTVTKPILTDGIALSGKISTKERKVFKIVFQKLINVHPEWNLWKVYGAKFWKTDVNKKTPEEVGIDLANRLHAASK